MDKSVHHIISKLKVLSKLQSGQKIMIEDSKIQIMECDKNNWSRFVKWWLGETRYTTVDKLQGFHLEIKDVISALLENKDKNKSNLDRIGTELHACLRGLSNLMLTYQGDQTVVAQIETLYENFNMELKRITEACQLPSLNSLPKQYKKEATKPVLEHKLLPESDPDSELELDLEEPLIKNPKNNTSNAAIFQFYDNL